MTTGQFVKALIALLSTRGARRLNPRDRRVHTALAEAVRDVGEERAMDRGVEIYVDPITGTIAELFAATSVLQGYGLAARPNPKYPDAEIAAVDLCRSLDAEDLQLVEAVAEKLIPRLAACSMS